MDSCGERMEISTVEMGKMAYWLFLPRVEVIDGRIYMVV